VLFWIFLRRRDNSPICISIRRTVHLAWGDVSSDHAVFLKWLKTNQFGHGVEIFVGATGGELCPVSAILAYARARGVAPGPFFKCENGSPLTKARFVEGVRNALARAGVSSEGYYGHSFRIGAATAAARAGIQDSVIQALGRWSSPAFLRYIRTPRENLAVHSRTLTGSSTC